MNMFKATKRYELYSGIDTYSNDKNGIQIHEELVDFDSDFGKIYSKYVNLCKRLRKKALLAEHENHRLFVYIVEVDLYKKLPTVKLKNNLYSKTIYFNQFTQKVNIDSLQCKNGEWVMRDAY